MARTANRVGFERALISSATLVTPILCALFPTWVTMQKVATAVTDKCGHFETFFFRGCNNPDTPDLYFKATQKFFGFDVLIYAPTPIPCYTHWNYKCGTEVKLVTSHPFAIACLPCPPVNAKDWVLFTAIGGISMARIHGSSQVLQGTTNATNRGLTDDGRPFGGTLRPRLDFDNKLRESLGVKYYKLWWQRTGTTKWHEILGDVSRHYAHMIGTQFVVEEYKLGPKNVVGADENNLYEIPPAVPPIPIGQWSVANPILDTQNGVSTRRRWRRGLPTTRRRERRKAAIRAESSRSCSSCSTPQGTA